MTSATAASSASRVAGATRARGRGSTWARAPFALTWRDSLLTARCSTVSLWRAPCGTIRAMAASLSSSASSWAQTRLPRTCSPSPIVAPPPPPPAPPVPSPCLTLLLSRVVARQTPTRVRPATRIRPRGGVLASGASHRRHHHPNAPRAAFMSRCAHARTSHSPSTPHA